MPNVRRIPKPSLYQIKKTDAMASRDAALYAIGYAQALLDGPATLYDAEGNLNRLKDSPPK